MAIPFTISNFAGNGQQMRCGVMNRWLTPVIALLLLAGLACPPAERQSSAVSAPCQVMAAGRALPNAVRETSGLAVARRDSTLLWTHNDSGNEPVLFALDTAGNAIGQVMVTGAGLIDWEDMAAGPCDAGTCLFIGDIGDNTERRDSVTIYVVPEPDATALVTEPATALHARYPDRAQDAEALFVLPGGDIYIVTKGRRGPIALYRYPKAAQDAGGTATMERVRSLSSGRARGLGRVTGAAASPDGRFTAIRTYATLYLYETGELIGLGSTRPAAFDLRPLKERQGEAVALTDSGEVWLTSEAERGGDFPAMTRLRCTMPEAGPASP